MFAQYDKWSGEILAVVSDRIEDGDALDAAGRGQVAFPPGGDSLRFRVDVTRDLPELVPIASG